MKILIDIGHPAHVHVFKNFYKEALEKGHEMLFTTKDKECTLDLLEAYDLPYVNLGKPFSGAARKVYGLWHFGKKLHAIAKKFDTDLFLSISSMYAAQVSTAMNKPHITLDDTEHSYFEHALYRPFSDYILTPSCFEKHMGGKQIRYDGYHELAYLHPNRFRPNPNVVKDLGIEDGEAFSVLRFVSWNAGHDIKETGISLEKKRELVEKMKKYGKVFISSEKTLPEDLEEYRINVPAQDLHSVLNEASLYVGEGASMASECAMLGTPAMYINSLDAGTLKEQEAYGLIYSFRDMEGVIQSAELIMSDPDIGSIHKERRDTMLAEKIDVTDLIVNLVEKVYEKEELSLKHFTKMNFRIQSSWS